MRKIGIGKIHWLTTKVTVEAAVNVGKVCIFEALMSIFEPWFWALQRHFILKPYKDA